MLGNHIDCRVLATLTAEHLPRLAMRLNALDVTVQLLTTRWFLCLWSSVLPTAALHRLWDYLFLSGPAATMQAALACMFLCEPSINDARDIGDALAAVRAPRAPALDCRTHWPALRPVRRAAVRELRLTRQRAPSTRAGEGLASSHG